MLKYVVATVVLLSFATPALAEEWYVVQDPKSKKCDETQKKPDGQTQVMIGTAVYASKVEAKAAKKAAAECPKKTDANKS